MIQNNSQGLCIECNEAIFNPICVKCLVGQLDTWFLEEGIDGAVRKKIKEFIAREEDKPPFEGIRCAICSANETSICPYCFTEYVYYVLKKLKPSKKILEDFLTYFNYDFEHNGYSKDFEENFGGVNEILERKDTYKD